MDYKAYELISMSCLSKFQIHPEGNPVKFASNQVKTIFIKKLKPQWNASILKKNKDNKIIERYVNTKNTLPPFAVRSIPVMVQSKTLRYLKSI